MVSDGFNCCSDLCTLFSLFCFYPLLFFVSFSKYLFCSFVFYCSFNFPPFSFFFFRSVLFFSHFSLFLMQLEALLVWQSSNFRIKHLTCCDVSNETTAWSITGVRVLKKFSSYHVASFVSGFESL